MNSETTLLLLSRQLRTASNVHGLLPQNDPEQESVVGDEGLVSAAEAEDTSIESVEEVIADKSPDDVVLGRGHRKKFRNKV